MVVEEELVKEETHLIRRPDAVATVRVDVRKPADFFEHLVTVQTPNETAAFATVRLERQRITIVHEELLERGVTELIRLPDQAARLAVTVARPAAAFEHVVSIICPLEIAVQATVLFDTFSSAHLPLMLGSFGGVRAPGSPGPAAADRCSGGVPAPGNHGAHPGRL